MWKKPNYLIKQIGNTFWKDAIEKELKNVRVTFRLLEDNEPIPVGSKLIDYHIIFDVKMDLTRKARLVAGGHRNKNVPAHQTFSSVASRDSVRIVFLIVALDGLNVLSADVGNAYLNTSYKEKVNVVVGKELFGVENIGKTCVIVRGLYDLKSIGTSWRAHLREQVKATGFVPTIADNDVYMKQNRNKNNKFCYTIGC